MAIDGWDGTMTAISAHIRKAGFALLGGLAVLAMPVATPVFAQGMETIDPDTQIDGDLESPGEAPVYGEPDATMQTAPRSAQNAGIPPEDVARPSVDDAFPRDDVAPQWSDPVVTSPDNSTAATQAASDPAVASAQGDTYKEDDLIGAAEGVFGKGAEGVARLIQDLLKKQGEPNAYIVGREAGGAFIVGARYGSGTLYHRVEGQKPVYWTGPSVGFDAGANAGNTFVLVYNLFDSEELYKRYPAGEGQLYAVGGMNVSYMRRGDVVLIPIRVGAGLRAGINAGYMRFSKKQRWVPF